MQHVLLRTFIRKADTVLMTLNKSNVSEEEER
jgi:hypothetical protein